MAVGADLASISSPDVPEKDVVAVYAKFVGELLCICINTVPQIMHALSTLTPYMTRASSQHYGYNRAFVTSRMSSISQMVCANL
jgi:hypothetical protein